MKITKVEREGVITVQLVGRLTGQGVEELKRVTDELADEAIVFEIDLRDLTFSDLGGRHLLGQIYRRSSPRFITNTALGERLAEEAMGPAASIREAS